MKIHLPELLITADRGHLVAYKTRENGALDKVASEYFGEATLKISEMVTDQAGAFATPGGYGTGSAERLPMQEELELRAMRKVAAKIRELLETLKPLSWGFAASSEINNAILDGLEDTCLRDLSLNLKANLANSPVETVADHFRKARAEKTTQPV
jgi:Protein required for attachment to host cells